MRGKRNETRENCATGHDAKREEEAWKKTNDNFAELFNKRSSIRLTRLPSLVLLSLS